ncbi:MAG: hypothetical protein AAGA03_07005 [Planctomycetota bacterium]
MNSMLRIGMPSRLWSRLGLVATLLCLCVDSYAETPLEAGFARTDITPPVGFRIAGNYFESFSQAVDEPLHARVMYLAQGNTKTLTISLDVCSIGRVVSDPIRHAIQERTGVPFDHIIVSATHNHAGPEYYGTLRDYLHQKALRENGGVDPAEPIDYAELLVRRLTQASKQAIASAVTAVASCGETTVTGIAFNRRFHMKDGTVRMNPGYQNPNIVRVAGPVDPRLPVLLLRRASDRHPIGLYTSFAMHTATYGDLTRFGADFPGVLDRRMQAEFGDDFVALFGEGTAGDVNHLDFLGRKQGPDRWKVYQEIGNRLSDAIIELIPSLSQIDQPSLKTGRSITPVPLQSVDTAKLAEAPEVVFAPRGEKSFLEKVAAWKQMNTDRLRRRDGERLQVELQCITIGDQFAIVSLPHEVFVELGMMIRSGSPYPVTAVISLAQDLDFYVPTRKAFAEGSYEVTTSSIQPGGGEQIADAAIELLRSVAKAEGQR